MSASECVLFLGEKGKEVDNFFFCVEQNCVFPSILFQARSVMVHGGWTAFEAFLATVGRLVSLTFVVCRES